MGHISSVPFGPPHRRKYTNPTTTMATETIQARPHAGKVVCHATVHSNHARPCNITNYLVSSGRTTLLSELNFEMPSDTSYG